MVGTFLRHGSNIWLALGLAALIVCFAAGILPFYLLWVVIGALSFYVSEYGFHRFGFHAEPSRFAFVRTLQHRLHYDHHAEPDRLDLLFLPVWFLIPNLAVTALTFALLFGWSVVASAMFGVALAIFHYEWVHCRKPGSAFRDHALVADRHCTFRCAQRSWRLESRRP